MDSRPLARRVVATALLVAGLALGLAGCRSPHSIESGVEFETERGIVRGVATEGGIYALADVVPPTGELSFRCRTGNGFFDDTATVVRRGDAIAVFEPKSSHLNLARFAGYPAAAADALFIETHEGGEAGLIPCHLFESGKLGDLLTLDDDSVEPGPFAQHYAGSGIFAWRDKSMQLIGMLNGVYSPEPKALAFVGLDEMATLLPAESSYFARRVTTRRADFEYGIPRDFAGEKPSAADAPAAPEPDEPAPHGN